MINTLPELLEYLEGRGDKYGISAQELMDAIPESAREPKLAYEFMQQKDISHKIPLSKGGNPAGDNWILEDSSVNRARGNDIMTTTEEVVAHVDNHADALRMNVVTPIMAGAGLATGGLVVEGATTAGALAGTAAVAAAEATFVTTVVVPAVVTTTIIGGAGWLLWRGWKALSN